MDTSYKQMQLRMTFYEIKAILLVTTIGLIAHYPKVEIKEIKVSNKEE